MTDNDVLSRMAQLTECDPVMALRLKRPLVAQHSQASFQALFEPANPGDFTRIEREAVALRVSRLHGCKNLEQLHIQRLAALGVDDAQTTAIVSGTLDGSAHKRLATILSHAELLSLKPADATRAHLQTLAGAGLSTAAIVSLSQLIGFVAFEARLLAGLALLGSNT